MNKQVLGIFGATASNDFGDYAMLVNDIRSLYCINKNIEIKVFSYHIENTQLNLDNNLCDITNSLNIQVVPDLIDFNLNKNDYKEIWNETYNGNLSNINTIFLNNLKLCDKIIFIGGGYINNNWDLINIVFMTIINCAKALGKDIFFLGSTIGPLNEEYKNIIGKSLKFVKSIMIRDNCVFSEKNLIEMNYQNIIKGPDDFMFVLNRYNEDKYPKSNYIIIELMIQLNKADKGYPYVIAELAKFSNYIINKECKDIVLVSFHKDDYYANEYIEELYSLIDSKNNVYIQKNIDDVYMLNDMYKNCDFSLSFRYHPLVMALGNKKPGIGIITDSDGYYNSKFGGVISNLELDATAMSMHVNELSFKSLLFKYENLKNFKVNNSKYKELYETRVKYMEHILR